MTLEETKLPVRGDPAPGPRLPNLNHPPSATPSQQVKSIFSSLLHRSGWSLIEASQLFRSLVFSTDRRCGLPFACSPAAFSNIAGHSTSNPLHPHRQDHVSVFHDQASRSSHSLQTAKLKGRLNSSGKRSFVVCHWSCRFSPACCSPDQPANSSFVSSESFVLSSLCLLHVKPV